MHDGNSFGDRIMVQLATGGLVGMVADRMLTVVIGMIASLFVGVVMEFVKYRIAAGHKRRDQDLMRANAPALPPSQISGGFCAVPSKTLPGLPTSRRRSRKPS